MQDKVSRDEAVERGRNRQNKPKDKQKQKMMLRTLYDNPPVWIAGRSRSYF
jgi:hypothetical protein